MSDASPKRPVLAVRELVKRYEDGERIVQVLDQLELAIQPGERVAIVGESGVGKSTLLHILGLLDEPTSGTVELDGQDISSLVGAAAAQVRNRQLGFVFQFHHLLPDFTAEENVMMPALVGGATHEVAREQAQQILIQVGLADRLDHKPGELSGGEQQRVAVARAVVLSPKLVLADEPTGNLDPATGGAVQDLLIDLNRERGAALVVVTHSVKLADAMDRVLRLTGGHLEVERS